MLTPDYLLHISEGAEDIASELHSDIVRRIIERMMARLGRGEDYLLTATDKWQLEVLQDAGYLLSDIQTELASKTKLQTDEIKEAMEDAGVKALEYDDKIYQAAGLSPAPLEESPHLIRLMQRNYEATLGEWRNFTRTTAEAAQRTFLKEVDKAYNLVSSGAVSYTQAVKEAVDTVAGTGVEVTYPTGHKDTIETATLRAVRTGISQATGAIQMARLVEMDWDIILTSAHLGARTGDGGQNPGNHLWWQGQFFSRTGRTPDFPLFVPSTGYGTVTGICGANCRHSFGPGDGVNNPFADREIAFADNYKIEQMNKRQRLLERRIRKTKRELQGLQAAIDNCKDDKLKAELQRDYDRKANLLSKQNKAYNDFCEENDLKRLPDRIQIAKWGREQAAKARSAARRYEKSVEKSGDFDTIKTGARIKNPESPEGCVFAESFYEEVRKRSTDCKKIAQNLGKEEADIQKVKDYLFMNKSLYDEDLKTWRTFDPDCAIAQSWQRLTDGKKILKHDRTLIEHELYEMEIKAANKGITHDEAHALAQDKYNYRKEADEYYGNLDKSKK